MRTVCIDFETYSELDVKDVGAEAYARHPSTDIICLSYSMGGEPQVWAPWLPFPDDLTAEVYEAHNVAFERAIWRYVGEVRYGFPRINGDQWRCTLAACAYKGVALKLEKAAQMLRLDQQKDMAGNAAMRYLSKPSKKGRREDFTRYEACANYCAQDVRTEIAVSRKVGHLPPDELKVWQTDQAINQRGVLIDQDLCHAAIDIAQRIEERLVKEFQTITGGLNPSQVGEVTKWCGERWVGFPDLRADTITDMLALHLPDDLRRALEIRQQLARASTKKYQRALACVCPDGRARGMFQYHGASTGRWCLTGDHEVLTPEGWRRLDEWSGGSIACWTPEGEQISFADAEMLAFPFSGELVRLTSTRIDQLSTEDHAMPCWTKRGEFQRRPVRDFEQRLTLPYTGFCHVSSWLLPEVLRVLVMVQADGHFTEDGILRLAFTKARKVFRCRHVLAAVGIGFTEQFFSGDGRTVFTVPRRMVPGWLAMFRDKTFGWWLLDCDPEVLFEELPHWDGYNCGPTSIQYSTTNRQNADVIQACAHLSGRSANIVEKHRDTAWSTAYVVNIWNKASNRHEFRKKLVRVPYFGTVYCASTPTGYFLVRRGGRVWVTGNSGRHIQLQNMPRPAQEHFDMGDLCALIKSRDIEAIEMIYGDPMTALADAVRGMIIPASGHVFAAFDFSSIEAVALACMFDETWKIEAFRRKEDVYCLFAETIYKHKVTKVEHPKKRQTGKTGELAFGYGGGVGAWRKFDDSDAHTDEEVDEYKRLWRKKHARIAAGWKGLDDAAVAAVAHGVPQEYAGFRYEVGGDWLSCRLLSGRKIWYLHPRVIMAPMPWTDDEGDIVSRPAVEYTAWKEGQIKTVRGWGGLWTENCDQAISRDIMVGAMLRCEREGLPIVLHAHDELVAEVPEDQADDASRRMKEIMETPLSWTQGWPIRAEGGILTRYRK